MRIHSATEAANDSTLQNTGAVPAPRFTLRLPLGFYVSSSGTWGTGSTCSVSRTAVEFETLDRSIGVGDMLNYVVLFPGSGDKAGAVASCRGRIISAAAGAVVVTIDQYRLQPAAAVRTAGRNAWNGWLVALCEATRRSGRAAAGLSASRGLSAASPA